MIRPSAAMKSKIFVASLAFLISSVPALAQESPPSNCRCLYGDPCWPSEADFAQLESRLSQPLIYPSPPEASCYPASNPSENCTDVQENSQDGRWISDQPGSFQYPNFEDYIFPNGTISACYLNSTLGFPCEQGSIPPVGVDARSAEDIQAAVRFAAEHNLRLVVKNTGHDLLGRSTARNAFMIWTHHLKEITYHDAFVPSNSNSSESFKALTFGAGVQWYEAYDAAEQNGRVIVGGSSDGGSVGAAGGWMLGGGHGALAPVYGLGVDNALQFTVVVASGEYLTANAYTNPDLFWALRGGGGGTFGVVTSVTHLTHPSTPVSAVFIDANFSSLDVAREVTAEFFRIQPGLADSGWGGYSWILNTSLSSRLLAPNVSDADANATFAPFAEFVKSKSNDSSVYTAPFASFHDWNREEFYVIGPQVGFNSEISGRFYSRKTLETNHEKMADVILSFGAVLNNVAGGAVNRVDPDSVGVHPGWRDAIFHAFNGVSWPEGATAEEIESKRELLRSWDELYESIEPGAGTYFNEGSLYEKDFRHTLFGSHYERLLEIKDVYDPSGLFIVAQGVSSERWDESLNCRK
ncbi:hypothetical protein VNI00_001014 [Paramarasmius palmivorus]|uniref:FAD-binding PCMH-type domain-containing protein n=1 Tax=Paramarasmius palmivorus TaxID=297713 RepID=A0AAW0EB37_9AGAR